jgi:hypothetical protein
MTITCVTRWGGLPVTKKMAKLEMKAKTERQSKIPSGCHFGNDSSSLAPTSNRVAFSSASQLINEIQRK